MAKEMNIHVFWNITVYTNTYLVASHWLRESSQKNYFLSDKQTHRPTLDI